VNILRIIGRFPDKKQVSALVDSLRNIGLDRKDMIISNLTEEQKFRTVEDAAKEMIFLKSERDGLGEIETFASGIKGLEGDEGIIVAVEIPKHSTNRVREAMEQSGAVEIIQD
jgi:hypothetical protein